MQEDGAVGCADGTASKSAAVSQLERDLAVSVLVCLFQLKPRPG